MGKFHGKEPVYQQQPQQQPQTNEYDAIIQIAESALPWLDPGELDVDEYPKRDVPPGMPLLPFLGGIYGTRGKGKTTTMCKLIKAYDTGKSFDRVIVFSPTLAGDPKLRALQEGQNYRLEVYDKFDDMTFLHILNDTKSRIKTYWIYKKACEVWEEIEAGKPLDEFTHEEMVAIQAYGMRDPKLTGHFRNGPPSQLIVFDDFVGDRTVYKLDGTNEVGKFALRHRHFFTSLLFLVQAHNGGGGIPRQHRNNLSLTVLFGNKSPKMKKEFAEDFCGDITPEEFVALWDHATEGDHDFLMIDYARPRPSLMYRRNFTDFLSIDNFAGGDPLQDIDSVSEGYIREDAGGKPGAAGGRGLRVHGAERSGGLLRGKKVGASFGKGSGSDSEFEIKTYSRRGKYRSAKKRYEYRHDPRRGRQIYGGGSYGAGRKVDARSAVFNDVFGGTTRDIQ